MKEIRYRANVALEAVAALRQALEEHSEYMEDVNCLEAFALRTYIRKVDNMDTILSVLVEEEHFDQVRFC
jgi:hypothetical protein